MFYTSSAYTIDLQKSLNPNYSLHMQRVFTQHWLNSFWIATAWSILPFILQGKQSDECIWRIMYLSSRNLYKCQQVACSVVVACLLIYTLFLHCTLLLPVYFLIPFFILMLLLYFYLLVDHGSNHIIFAHQVRSNAKILLTVFFDWNGVMHYEFLPQGRMVNKEYNLEFIRMIMKPKPNHHNGSVQKS